MSSRRFAAHIEKVRIKTCLVFLKRYSSRETLSSSVHMKVVFVLCLLQQNSQSSKQPVGFHDALSLQLKATLFPVLAYTGRLLKSNGFSGF
jgi:hypothetical protein